MKKIVNLLYGGVLSAGLLACSLQEKKQIDCISGIYPHLAFYNDEGECGTGAVVPWNGSLWPLPTDPTWLSAPLTNYMRLHLTKN